MPGRLRPGIFVSSNQNGKPMRRAVPFVLISTCLLLGSPAFGQESGGAAKPLLQDTAGNCPTKLPFTHVLTNEPLQVLKADKEITPAVEQLHCTGENAYNGDAAAIEDGKKLFRLCASCHGPKGEGRIGPSLIDQQFKYERVARDHGEFEVIYGGAAGAMQPMGRRFDQDQILRIMAYIDSIGAQ
jgi:cytochrome c-L